MSLLFIVVIIIFFIIQTKIIHYSSLIYIPGCYFASLTIQDYINNKQTSLSKIEWISFISSLSIYLILTLLLPFLINNPEVIIPYIDDINLIATITQNLQWNLLGFLPGIFLLLIGIIISYLFYRKFISAGIKLLVISTMFFTNSLWCFYLPNLEKYTQGSLINYYKKSVQNQLTLLLISIKHMLICFMEIKKYSNLLQIIIIR